MFLSQDKATCLNINTHYYESPNDMATSQQVSLRNAAILNLFPSSLEAFASYEIHSFGRVGVFP